MLLIIRQFNLCSVLVDQYNKPIDVDYLIKMDMEIMDVMLVWPIYCYYGEVKEVPDCESCEVVLKAI